MLIRAIPAGVRSPHAGVGSQHPKLHGSKFVTPLGWQVSSVEPLHAAAP